MDSLIKKIQDLEREARRLKSKELREVSTPPTQPSTIWSLRRERPDRRSPPRPTAARSLTLLEKKFQSSPAPPPYTVRKEPFEGDGNGDWWTAFKTEAGPWKGKKLVVLSLFDGIGGIWAALTRLGIPFVGYSSEVSAPAIQVVKAKFPEVRHVGDVRKLTKLAIPEKVDLVVGGFPCQDLSCMGKKEGLHGPRSKLFFDLLGILKDFAPRWFLVENVASMTWIDREEISKYLRVQPLELDSIELTPSRRKRLYWTNIPHPSRLPRVREHPSTFVQSCLHNAIALEEKTGGLHPPMRFLNSTFIYRNASDFPRTHNRFVALCRFVQTKFQCVLGYSTDTANSCTLEQVLEVNTNELRKITQMEVEQILGYLPNHTNVKVEEAYNNYHARLKVEEGTSANKRGGGRGGWKGQESTRKEPLKAAVRWMLLGNTFTVPVIAYLLSPLLKSSLRNHGNPVYLPGSVLEKDCSVMEPDDVWALYNEHERPNWYALITKRSGDRFTRRSHINGKKPPLYIEMQYLELTSPYLDGEDDEWNPLRGTGQYELRQETDIQVSWTSFSHRVTNFVRSNNKVFIFPAKDEVWTVYSRQTWSPFFVYIIESSVDVDSLQSATPGSENFYAKCYLIIKTGDHETYRRTDKVLEFFDLSVFCFCAPYNFKQETNLLRVEVGTKGRKLRKIETMIRRTKRKRGKSSDSFSDEDDEDELDAEEAEVLIEEESDELDGLAKEVDEFIAEVEARVEVVNDVEINENDEADGAEDELSDGPVDDLPDGPEDDLPDSPEDDDLPDGPEDDLPDVDGAAVEGAEVEENPLIKQNNDGMMATHSQILQN